MPVFYVTEHTFRNPFSVRVLKQAQLSAFEGSKVTLFSVNI
jgi:hypothetical protein